MAFQLGILAFRIGDATASILPERYLQFYERLGCLFTGSPVCTIVGRERITTSPIPQAEVKEDNLIYELAISGISAIAPGVTLLIADLANPPRDHFPNFNLIQSLSSALSNSWWSANSDRRAVVLLPRPLSTKDRVYELVRSNIDAGRLILIDNEGDVHGKLPVGLLNRAEYQSALKVVQDDALTLLKQKMIRRVGYFRHRSGVDGYATKYFYDGRLCENEIVRLLQAEHAQSPVEQILVHAPVSSWLNSAAEAIGYHLDIEVIDLSDKETALAQGQLQLHKKPLVLSPLIDSGRTIARLHSALLGAKPDCEPKYLAILSTKRERDGRRLVEGTEPEVFVKYFLPVTQVYYSSARSPQCMAEHQGSQFDIDAEPVKLTSYVFWDMVDEKGFKEEDDVPKHWRSSLGLVPRFPEVMQANGPLLAYKIDQLLRRAPGGLPVDPVLICPEEKGAIEVTDCVKSMFDYDVVRVPREVIDNRILNASPDEIRSFVSEHHNDAEWLLALRTAGRGDATRGILIDEFAATGGTFERLERLCDAAGLKVEHRFALIDFKLGRSRSTDLSLYEIPLGGT
jgi:hypothetical protein